MCFSNLTFLSLCNTPQTLCTTQSSSKGKSKIRNRSKSVHTSEPLRLETDVQLKEESNEELAVPEQNSVNGHSDPEDVDTDGEKTMQIHNNNLLID